MSLTEHPGVTTTAEQSATGAPGTDAQPAPIAPDGTAIGTDAGVDLTAGIGPRTLPNPVLTASGTAGYGRELDRFFDIAELGGIVTKSIMLEPRSGRPTPRMAETPSGMLNSIGLQGPGIDAFLERDLPWLVRRGARPVVSIAGSTVEEFEAVALRLRPHLDRIAAVEVNISCPNVANRGLVFACNPGVAGTVLHGVRRVLPDDVPVFAKLSPDVTDIVEVAWACAEGGADGVSLINTVLGMVIDTRTMRPVLGGVTGGLSGPAVRPIAVRAVWQVHAAMPNLPIIGMGGIRTGTDALEMILAGASAVQVGTVTFNDPSAPLRVLTELAAELADRGVARLSDVVGHAHRVLAGEAAPFAGGADR